jgi:hypothetical protein
MPNTIAYGMLIGWPIITIILFALLPLRQAIIWSLLGGHMLLPYAVAFDLTGLPRLDKTSIASLSTFLCTILFARGQTLRAPPSGVVAVLIGVFLFAPLATALTNADPLLFRSIAIPGLTIYDALALGMGKLITILPFIIGYSVLANERAHRDILVALVVGALIYALPILLEVRLSPQLHRWVYGFHPHEFQQSLRGGAFRPVVFMGHGLLVALFLAMSVIASTALLRTRERMGGLPMVLVLIVLLALLLLTRSYAAIGLGVLFSAIFYMVQARRVVLICFALAAVALTYPFLRGADLLPMQSIVRSVEGVNLDRANSARFRIENEDILLAKANQRPLFGWGSWGRNRVYADMSWGETRDIAVTDGFWVITIGQFGWLGYIATFGLLCYPFLRAMRRRKNTILPAATVALLLIHLANVLDLLPNSSLLPTTWLVAGALAGMVYAHLPRRRLGGTKDESSPTEEQALNLATTPR